MQTSPNPVAPRALLVTFEHLAAIVGVGLADQTRRELLSQGAVEAFTPPVIGDYWPGQGGVYAGQVREDDGTQYHVILADAKPAARLPWAAALKWAKTVTVDGHADFEVPTRRASALLFANLPHLFEKTWHWTSAPYAPNESDAWICDFGGGLQGYGHKGYGTAARAVRRFVA